MDKHGVVPDVIPTRPQQTLKVQYPGVEVNLGNELTPTQVKDQPTSVTWSTEPASLYTLLMTDPDIPAQFNFKQMNHWLVVNIPGADIAKGKTLYEYVGSGPPEGTGLHRYIFLVYRQAGVVEDAQSADVTDMSREDRAKYSPADLTKKFNLGPLVAGNYYRAQYDDYVPILRQKRTEIYEQLKGNK